MHVNLINVRKKLTNLLINLFNKCPITVNTSAV